MSTSFLARWSQRKRGAAHTAKTAPAPPPERAAPPPAAVSVEPDSGLAAERAADAAPVLPPVEELSLASDFSAFLKEGVSEALRRQALKKLFADPHFNRMDGLDIYIDDYSVPDPIPPQVLRQLNHAREWLFDRDAAAGAGAATADAADAADAPAAAEGALPSAPAPARARADDVPEAEAEAGAASGAAADATTGDRSPDSGAI